MRIKQLLSALLLALPYSNFLNAQPIKGDTVLYLLFDTVKHYKNSNTIGIDFNARKENPESRYSLRGSYHLYDGYPLDFVSVRKENSQVKKIKREKIVTPEELRHFIIANYRKMGVGYNGSPYFDSLKKIYIVEPIDRKKKYRFTEVRLDIEIE